MTAPNEKIENAASAPSGKPPEGKPEGKPPENKSEGKPPESKSEGKPEGKPPENKPPASSVVGDVLKGSDIQVGGK